MVVEEKRNEINIKEWNENGSLSPELLTDYSNDFLQFLQQMQYNADSLQTSLVSKWSILLHYVLLIFSQIIAHFGFI